MPVTPVTNIDVAQIIQDFIDTVATQINANIDVVLVFAGGVLVWFVLKKWVFGSTRRI